MYSNWDQKVQLIGPYQWISVTDLTTYLRELRTAIMFTPRRLTATRLPRLNETLPPCTETERFPNNQYYLYETDNWKMEMDLLQLAVDVMINKKKLKRNYAEFKTVGEAECFALEKINHIINLVSDENDSIMSQDAFENEFDLVWVATPPSNTPNEPNTPNTPNTGPHHPVLEALQYDFL